MHMEHVVELASKLEVYPLREMEILIEVPVEIALSIQPKNVSSQSAEIPEKRLRQSEAQRIITDGNTIHHSRPADRCGRGRGCGLRIKARNRPGYIRPTDRVPGESLHRIRQCAQRGPQRPRSKMHWITRPPGGDSGKRPTAQSAPQPSVRRSAEKGNLPGVADAQDVAQIELARPAIVTIVIRILLVWGVSQQDTQRVGYIINRVRPRICRMYPIITRKTL